MTHPPKHPPLQKKERKKKKTKLKSRHPQFESVENSLSHCHRAKGVNYYLPG